MICGSRSSSFFSCSCYLPQCYTALSTAQGAQDAQGEPILERRRPHLRRQTRRANSWELLGGWFSGLSKKLVC